MDETAHKQALWQKGLVRDLAALALLLALCLLFFWRIITPNLEDRASFRHGDFYDQFYAFAAFEYDQLSQGQLPLWNPHTFSGHPFLADVQSAVYYPLSLLNILLGTYWGFSAFALELEAIAHFFLAGIFTYLFAKRALNSRSGALISAVVFAFGGYLTSFPPLQLAILETVIWLPLILLLLDLGVTELGRRRRRRVLRQCSGLATCYLLLAGLVLGIAIFAGHPQSALHVAYLSVLYYLFRVWLVRKQEPGRIANWPAVTGLLAFILAGLGLAAAQLLPSVEFMRLSSRLELGYQELSGGFYYLDLLQILLPHSTGFWSPLYVGILPLLLVLFAIVLLLQGKAPGQTSRQRQRWQAETAFWTIVAGISLLLTLGGETFLYNLFYLFAPGFSLFRGQERAALGFSLALSMLAGYGFTAAIAGFKGIKPLEGSHRTLLRLIAALALVLGPMLALFFFGRSTAGTPPEGPMNAMLSLGVFVAMLLGGSLLWLLLCRRWSGKGLIGLGFALALILFDLFTVNARPNVQQRRIENQYRASGVIRELQAQDGIFRVHNEFRLPGNYGCIHGLEDTWGASPLRLASYERFVEQVPQERAWELLNVRYVVTWLDDLSTPAEPIYEEPAKRDEITYIHRLEAEPSRVWLVYETEVVSGEDEALARLAQPDFDPQREAVLYQPLESRLAGQPGGESRASLVGRSPSSLLVDVDQPADGLLLFSELHYPGWQAKVDGQPAPVLVADAILRAVEVPAGRHQVEVKFNPPSVKAGLVISAATLALVLTYGLWCLISHVRKPSA
jgi:hypothetical protein